MITSSSHLIIDPQLTLSIEETADTHFIDGLENAGIDNIREFNRWLLKKPFANEYKIGFIKSADSLTIEAQNALLKNLEEPPANTYVVITAQNETNVLPTIRSRCFLHDREESINQLPFAAVLVRTQNSSEIPPIPAVFDLKSAILEAERISTKYKRDQLVRYIDIWVKKLVKLGGLPSIIYADKLLLAKEMLQHNTNIQLTFEAMLIDIVLHKQPAHGFINH